MKPLAEAAIKAQQEPDKVTFVPERFEHTYCSGWKIFMTGLFHGSCGGVIRFRLGTTNRPAKPMSGWKRLKTLKTGSRILTCWIPGFQSALLWPFSTIGWPNTDAPDYKRYYPTDTLVTGYDIIPFWVARMIFQGLHFTHQRPFQYTLIHGLMRDEQGRKMSKSLGNGIDPMDVIENTVPMPCGGS